MMNPRIRQRLRQAERVAAANKRLAAEKLFRDLIEEAPDLPEALLGLARVVDDPAERQALFEQVLALDPDNALASAGLAGELPSFAEEAWAAERGEETADAEEDPPTAADAAEPPAAEAEPIGLRCNRCGKLLDDLRQAKRTPVGYRCLECVRELEAGYFTATAVTYAIVAATTLALSLGAAFLLSLIGWWFVTIFLAPAAGSLVGRLAFRAGGRRRGRYLPQVGAAALIIGGLLILLLTWNLLVIGIYLFLGASAAYYQLR